MRNHNDAISTYAFRNAIISKNTHRTAVDRLCDRMWEFNAIVMVAFVVRHLLYSAALMN